MKKLVVVFIVVTMLAACGENVPEQENETEKEIISSQAPNGEQDLPQESELPEEKDLKKEETEEMPSTDNTSEKKTSDFENDNKTEVAEPSQSDINSLPNDASGWGFVKRVGEYPEFTAGQREMMKKYRCIYEGSHEEKVLYLTFDEGYENGYTPAILDTLKEKNVPATFFVTGPYLEKNDALVSRMLQEGHIVGNHSVNHPNMPSLKTKEAMQKEMHDLDLKFYEKYGSHMSYFRPPEGAYSERSLAATNDAGYTTVLWSFAYKDWETDNQQGAQHAFDSVIPYLHNGCVLLLHAVSEDNTEALGSIIDEARAQGYTFKSLDEFVF